MFSSKLISMKHGDFLRNVANIAPPIELDALLTIIETQGESIVSPTKRSDLNPFLIPVSQSVSDNSFLCYLRWPTQRDTMDLQLVRTTDAGVRLLSLNTRNYILRQAVEMDFYDKPTFSKVHDILKANKIEYNPKDFNTMLNSGKFPKTTDNDLRLVLDRYLLTKVGPFPDCYERLAENFLANNNEISALVTCERSASLFSSWAHPLYFNCKVLQRLKRDKEVREAATAAMNLPKWTVASNLQVSIR